MSGDEIDLTDPSGFSSWVTENIRIADTDAGGHINNTALAAYVESGRVARLRQAMFNRNPGERWVIAHLDIDFLAEASPPGEVRIGTRVLRFGTKSITLGAGLFKDDVCIATAHSIMVFLIGAETAPIPQDVREAFSSSDS